jgi:NAD(P)-dependent dehydrogenase (short-subunit alcohol dehydrogenase family)
MISTAGIVQDVDPRDWRTHRYGLPLDRWERLRDRTYWVTGAGTGFGWAIAAALASAGAQVFLTGRREDKLQQAIGNLTSLDIPTNACRIVAGDIRDPGTVERACAFIREHCPCLHGLVNNAAIPQRTEFQYPLQQETGQFWDEIMQVNVRAPWFVTKSALPLMLKADEVRVLFITSAAGWSFASGYGQYNITKAALNSLTACFAEECRTRFPGADIQINGLDPGQARTEMNQGSTRSPFTAACMALLMLSHPRNGPNGKFFSHDGRHLEFCNSTAYGKPLKDV